MDKSQSNHGTVAAPDRLQSRGRTIRFSQLPPQRQWLVKEMQSLGRGWLKHLVVTNGQPLSTPAPKKRPRYKLTGPGNRRAKWAHPGARFGPTGVTV